MSPGTRPTARGLMVMKLFFELRQKIEAQPDVTLRRSLRRTLESLQNRVDWWGATAPRPEQLDAMHEVLLELEEATDEARPVASF